MSQPTRTDMLTADGLRVYDLDPAAEHEVTAVAGPDNHTGPIDPEDLPPGFRWVDGFEWEALVRNAPGYAHLWMRRFGTDHD